MPQRGRARPCGGGRGSGPGSSPARRRRGGSRRSTPLRVDARLSDSTTASRSASICGRRSVPTGRSGWISRPEQRLVGVDVPHARDPLLVEQERLHRARLRPRAWSRRASAVKSGLSGSTPSREAKYSASASLAEQHVAGAEAAQVHEQDRLAVVELASARACAWLLVGQQDVAGHPQVHHQDARRPRATSPGTCRAAHSRSIRRPSSASAIASGGARIGPARVEHPDALEPPPLHRGRELAANRLDLGELRHSRFRVLRRRGPGCAPK